MDNCSVESRPGVDCGHGGTEEAARDWSLSVSSPGSEVRLREHGLGPPADCVFLGTNTGRDCYQTEQEGREQPAVSTPSVSPCDEAEGAQSGEEGARPTVGIPPPSSGDKRAEETREAVIREGQDAAEGEDGPEQEAEEDGTATRREEATRSDSTDPIKPCGDTKASAMGQSASSDGSEGSDTSDCEMKECPHEGGTCGRLSQAHCEGFAFKEGEAEKEGLTESVADPGGLPDPPPMDCGDVTAQPESAVPRLLIDRPHQGEPPPDINSLEQNQETAGGDYAIEQPQGSAPETGSCTVEEIEGEDAAQPKPEPGSTRCIHNTGPMEEPGPAANSPTAGNPTGDPSLGMAPCSGDHAPGTTDSLCSDDNDSFQSAGSSAADLFQPTLDHHCTEDQEIARTATADLSATGLPAEEPVDSQHRESRESPPAATAPTVTETGAEPESQPCSSHDAMEASDPEGTREELNPELPEGDLSPVSGDTWDSNLNTDTEGSASEVPSGILPEPGPPDGAVNSDVEEGQSTETRDQSAPASAEESVSARPEQGDSEMTADERSRCDDRIASEDEPPSPRTESEEKENPETPDAAEGASQGPAGAAQGELTLIYFSCSSGLF